MRPFVAALALATAAACAGVTDTGPTAAPAPVGLAAGDSLSALAQPAAFSGQLPCADCEAIATTLLLHPDGSYRRQDSYQGARVQGDGRFLELGHWLLVGDRIQLIGPGPDRASFRRVDEQQLLPLDLQGHAISTPPGLALRRRAAPATLDGQLRLSGQFRYYADAASLVDCASGLQFPVAGNEAFIALQGLYAESGVAPAAPLRVDVEGRLALRPAMEGDGSEEALLIDQATRASDATPCAVAALHSTLVGPTWTLVEIDGTPVVGAAERPTLRYAPVDFATQLSGSTGCNRYTGRTALRGSSLAPAPLAVTKRACIDPAVSAAEQRFVTVLSQGGWLSLAADTLRLAQAGRVVMRFTGQ